MPLNRLDKTPTVARAYDAARRQIAPEGRLFLLRHADSGGQGYEVIPLEESESGEVLTGWLPPIKRRQREEPLEMVLCETEGGVTEAIMRGPFAAVAYQEQEADGFWIYTKDAIAPPSIPILNEWAFRASYTAQPFVPVVSDDGGMFPLLFPFLVSEAA